MFANAGLRLMWTIVPMVVGVSSFAVYIASGHQLTASKVGVCVSLIIS